MAFGIAILASFLLSPLWARQLAAPLDRIVRQARDTALGVDSRWPRGRIAELNTLTSDLETMAGVMREREQRFSAIFNSSPSPMVVTDTHQACLQRYQRGLVRTVRMAARRRDRRIRRRGHMWPSTAERDALFARGARTGPRGSLAQARRRALRAVPGEHPPVRGGRAGDDRLVDRGRHLDATDGARAADPQHRARGARRPSHRSPRHQQPIAAHHSTSSSARARTRALGEDGCARQPGRGRRARAQHADRQRADGGIHAAWPGRRVPHRDAGRLRRTDLHALLASVDQASEISERSGTRRQLVTSFKQARSDQASSQRRRFSLAEVVDEIALTLLPSIKRTPYVLDTDIPADIELQLPRPPWPGARQHDQQRAPARLRRA